MLSPRRRLPRPDRLTLLIAAIAALGVALALARQATYGVWLDEDQINYINVARNLLAGDGFVNYYGHFYTQWPPGYPLLLAAASLGVFDPVDVAGPLNAIIFGLTIFVVGQYLRWRLASSLLAVWGCLATALALPLGDQAAQALSGSLFILLSTLALIQTDRFLATGKTASLLWAAAFCALAWQARYIGIAVPIVAGLLLLFQPGAMLRQRAGRIAIFALIVALPMALWLLRNYLVAGVVTGNRLPVDYHLPALLWDSVSIMAGWAWDFTPPLASRASLALLGLAAATAVLLAGRCARRQRPMPPPPRRDWFPVGIFGGFALAYFVLLIAAAMLGNTWDGIQTRFLNPLYIPLLLVAVFALDTLLSCEKAGSSLVRLNTLQIVRTIVRTGGGGVNPSLPAAALMLTLSLWLAVQVAPSADRIIRVNSDDPIDPYIGLTGPPWSDSATLRYIRENPLEGIVHTNDHILAMIHLHNANSPRLRISLLPVIRAGGPNTPPPAWNENLESWLANARDGDYVVWFDVWNNSYDFGAPQLRVSPGLEPVAELSDGFIFRVNQDYIPNSTPYHSALASIASGGTGEPAARAAYDIYHSGATLAYFKEPCTAATAEFFLHIFPATAATATLPAQSRQYGFESRHFAFRRHGALLDGKCLALVPIPDYDIAVIRTGQYIPGAGELWSAELYPAAPERYGRIAAALAAAGKPLVSSAYDIYRSGNSLIYAKEPCTAADAAAEFFLHIFPVDADHLPPQARQYDLESRHFAFQRYGALWDGKCLALVPLPDYPIASIRTGQYTPGAGDLWSAKLYPAAPERYGRIAAALAAAGKPLISSAYDIYRSGNSLIYAKEPCTAADAAAEFFLHIVPVATADLPPQSRQYGFENRALIFRQHGALLGGKCLALVPIPDYDIAGIRTGQYIPGAGELWSAELPLP